ncbi:hypothetical protein INR49_015671 [Caranx melampygus]|nr:hypothetical protein INR49_015671 [Caranx melampygus]
MELHGALKGGFFSGGDLMSQPVQTTSPALILTAERVVLTVAAAAPAAVAAAAAAAAKLRAVRSISCVLVFSSATPKEEVKKLITLTKRDREGERERENYVFISSSARGKWMELLGCREEKQIITHQRAT